MLIWVSGMSTVPETLEKNIEEPQQIAGFVVAPARLALARKLTRANALASGSDGGAC